MYHHYPSDAASPPPHQVHVSIGVGFNSIHFNYFYEQLIQFQNVTDDHYNFSQLRRPSEYVQSAIHPAHPIYPSNRLRTFSQFVRVIEETDMQLQRSMRGATRVC